METGNFPVYVTWTGKISVLRNGNRKISSFHFVNRKNFRFPFCKPELEELFLILIKFIFTKFENLKKKSRIIAPPPRFISYISHYSNFEYCCFLLPSTLILVNNLKDILLKFIGSGTGWKKKNGLWKKILSSP